MIDHPGMIQRNYIDGYLFFENYVVSNYSDDFPILVLVISTLQSVPTVDRIVFSMLHSLSAIVHDHMHNDFLPALVHFPQSDIL
eukprot:UN11103